MNYLLQRRRRFGGFSPAALFADGEAGVWLDPSDTSTMFTDTAGTTPATVGDPVALMLDKSQGLTLGPELVTNGTFDTDTDWLKGAGWTISGGVASFDGTDSPNSISQGSTVLAAGISYRVTITVSMSQGALLVRPNVGASAGGYQVLSSGTYSLVLVGSDGAIGCIAGNSGGRFIGTIDNISVRELPGNHATQAVVASRPEFRSGTPNFLRSDLVDDEILWTAPAGSYTIARLNSAGTVTILTGQALSGATDIFLEQDIAAYIAVDRALTAAETAKLQAYLERLA